MWLSLLKAFQASISKNPHLNSSDDSSKSSGTPCTAPSMPASRPTQVLSISQARLADSPAIDKTHLLIHRMMMSPIPTGRTPAGWPSSVSLLKPRILAAQNARYDAQGGEPLARKREKAAKDTRSLWLAYPCRISICLNSTESRPQGPAEPDKWGATSSTVS